MMINNNMKPIASLFGRQLALFSGSVEGKGYKMPVRQVQKRFKPKRPVQFYQGRALIYLNKQGLLTPTLLTAHLTVPMIYLGYLIKHNPWYLTFPAALPIMGFIQIFLFFRFVSHKRNNKYQVQRIYLTEDGDFVEIWLANKIRRTLQNTQDDIMFNIRDLKSPPQGDNELPRKGTQFPQSFTEMKPPAPWQYGWNKYDINRQNYIIPKFYQYANWQLLVPAMKGVQIDTSECPKTPVPIDELRKMPTLEEALKEAQEKKKTEEEWEGKFGELKYGEGEGV